MIEIEQDVGPSRRKLKDPKTLRVFFSSPFGGMEAEREILTRKYFPRFHHACGSRGVQFVAVDLRWGITSEAADSAQVINICLREIDRSDIFIGFFGQRYGWHGISDELLQKNFENAMGRYPWLGNYRDRSVTELEFLHGHLLKPGHMPAAVCFRNKSYDDSIRNKALAEKDHNMAAKFSAESERSIQLMADLVQRLQETQNQCLGLLLDYKSPEEGAKFMFDSVWDCCLSLLTESTDLNLTPENRLCHDTYVASRTTLYVGGNSYLKELDIPSLIAHPTVLVHGPAGSGKSALLANLVKHFTASKNKTNCIYYFIGCAQGTTEPKNILQYILDELQYINQEEIYKGEHHNQSTLDDVNRNEFHDIYVSVQNEMEKLSSSGKTVVIIIDGLNKGSASSKTAKHLYWLPERFPSGVYLVVSTVTSDTETFNLLVKERSFFDLEILPLSLELQEKLCKETLHINGKELSPHQLQLLIQAEQTKNPLFLKIVLFEISIYGSFRLLDRKINILTSSDGVKDLLNKVLERLEEDYNVKDHLQPLVQQVLSAIAVSHQGLSETELLDMFEIASHVWSPFYFAVEHFLINDAGLLRFAFSEFEWAVEERYLSSSNQRIRVTEHLVNYFDKIRKEIKSQSDISNPKLKRVAGELPWLQKKINDRQGLLETLSDLRIFYVLERCSVYELIDLWVATGCDQDSVCQRFLTAFDLAIADVYTYQTQDGSSNGDPPGYILLQVLRSARDMFSVACNHKAEVKVLQRAARILEGIQDKIEESTRVSLLREYSYHLACAHVNNTEFDKAEVLHKSVMEESRKSLQSSDSASDRQTLAFSCNGLGVLYLKQALYKQAEPLFEESIQLHKELGNTRCVAESIMNIGVIKLHSREPENALQHFSQAMQEFEKIYFGHLPVVVGNLLTNMALCHRRIGNAEKAEHLYLRSLEVKANAVGWNNEVIATCYLNLGSLEFYMHKNYSKAEEYTRKAVEILELNEVKLEQTEMWQTLENLVLMLISQNKFLEALPIFRRVFKMLQEGNKVEQGAASVHREMIRYLISQGSFEEAAAIAECHLKFPALWQPTLFILLDHCDLNCHPRPDRPRQLTASYALQELWPGNNELTAYLAQTYVLPAGDLDLLMNMLRTMDEQNPDFKWTSYKVGAIWCENTNNLEAAIRVLLEGLEKYPHAAELKSRLFDCYRKLQRYEEAYCLLKEMLAQEQDNPAVLLVGGYVALQCGDVSLCSQLWERVATMSDAELAEKARSALQNLQDE